VFKKKITWIIIGIIIVGVIIYFKSRGSKIEYSQETARAGDIVRTVSATGVFQSTEEADLAFQLSGKVQKVNVAVGDKVKKGTILAFLDQAEALATLRSYQADLQVQEDALLLSRRDWDTLKPEERDSAKASVDKYRSLVENAKADLRKNIIYASQDGLITKVDIKEGENAVANVTVITIIKEGDYEVEADVAESDIVEVALGQEVQMTFDALSSSDIFYGKVIEIEPASTVIQDVVYYKISIKLDKQDERLRRGMSVDADVETYKKENVVLVPSRAIKKDEGGKYVEILKDENQVEKIYIEVGVSGDEGETEIIQGLSVGQKVITLTKAP